MDLIDALNNEKGSGHTPNETKVELYWGDQPEVKEAIIKARVENKLSYRRIAQLLSQEEDKVISSGAVRNWLEQQGVF